MREVWSAFIGLQGLLVSCFLLLAGLTKLFSGRSTLVQQSVFVLLTKRTTALSLIWWGLGAVETGVGLLILGQPNQIWPRWTAVVLLVISSAYVWWAWRVAPDKSCGCFGNFSSTPISRDTVIRCAVLAIAACLATLAQQSWLTIVQDPGLVIVGLFELIGLGYISPELSRFFKWRADEDCAVARIPLEHSLAGLMQSSVWKQVSPYLKSQHHSDYWREGCWRFLCYSAVYDHKAAIAVFAIAVQASNPSCRVALVEEGTEEILLQLPSPPSVGIGSYIRNTKGRNIWAKFKDATS